MRPRFADLTSSELLYLANKGSENAWKCINRRALKGDPEAQFYLSEGQASMSGEACCESCAHGGTCGEDVGMEAAELNDYTMGMEPYELMGADPNTPVPLDFLMPHRLLDKAINAAANQAAPQLNRPITAPRPLRGLPIRRVLPPPSVRYPQWGVFMDYQQEPVETFDTLKAANDYAKATASQFPQGFPIFVIHANQEPPRAPYGYTPALQPAGPDVPMPYSSLDYAQDIQSGTRQPSAYEMYQLQQGQRI